MRWKGRRQSENIQDMRGRGGGFPGGFGRGGGGPVRIPVGRSSGGFSLSTLVIIAIIYFALRACGIDPLQMLTEGQGPGGGTVTQSRTQAPVNDEMKEFVGVVLAETEDVWNGIFKSVGQQYAPPTLVLFSGGVQSACGFASSATGPFYCPGDRKVYLDTDFFDQLARQFDASGDFAQAYVIAHEVAHHVQHLLGVTTQVEQLRRQADQATANELSVRVELQADCLAGVWAHHSHSQRNTLEEGDIKEGLNAASAIGDDRLQRKSQGYVVPDSFTHGSSAQRVRWFTTGLRGGDPGQCDTLAQKNL
jgi:predicted metalloprotease